VSPDNDKIELLIVMAERLLEAIQADIDALAAGRPQEMRSLDPEIQRLSVSYSREAANFDPARAKSAPAALRQRLTAVTGAFREKLAQHARLLTRVRSASEGIVKAVAEEVERVRAPTLTYAPAARQKPAPGAMVFNSVI
jgi:hypothetical protein